ncbi:MAG TPA: glycosyltransferase family 4 protein [Anaerolineales bacterium]|nr:glycosyltransferase family 4 protein [Anaerolineales bacterium]
MVLSPRLKLKVAHFYQESSIRFSEPQAAQLHIYHTIRGLQQAGHQVTLVALQGRRVLNTQDLEVFKSDQQLASDYARLGWSGKAPFKLIESGVRRLQSELRLPYLALFDSYRMQDAGSKNLNGFDLIHERFNLLSLGGVWASRKLGIPLILEVNADLLEQRRFKGRPERGLRRIYAEWATRVCFKAAARIICISTSLKDHLSRTWNIEDSKLTVLPCAADVDAFGSNRNSELVRQGLGLTTEPVVIWVGGYYPWHDLDLLLESFILIRRKYSSAKLVLVGDGPTRQSIAQKIQRNGLQQSVIMTGAIPHADVPEMLSLADIAVVPSAPVAASDGGTGTPLKLFEYMAAGKPIVATALNQAAEVIRDGHNGLLVQSGDVNSFAEAILRLLNNPGERVRLGQNARQQAIELYSWEEYTRRLEEIYLNVLGVFRTDPQPLNFPETVKD